MKCIEKRSKSSEMVFSIQPVNLQTSNLIVLVKQLSQTLSIWSMYKLCLGKNLFLATPLKLL